MKFIHTMSAAATLILLLSGCVLQQAETTRTVSESMTEMLSSGSGEATEEAAAVLDTENTIMETETAAENTVVAEMEIAAEAETEKVVEAEMPAEAETTAEAEAESAEEKRIYSYLQVPAEYAKDPLWAGDWTDLEAGGQKFFYFGCGICCLSNMCSTFSGSAVQPDVMFEAAKAHTDYDPDSGVGALNWRQLRQMTESFGADAAVCRKPEDYSSFQKDVETSDTVVVLVCKDNDDKLWWYTKGHYVNLWEYDAETDTVFVTDSSGLFNRTRLELIDIYHALKTASDAQYMVVHAP